MSTYGSQPFPRLSADQVERIRTLSAAGHGHRAIAAMLGLSRTTVARARWYLGLTVRLAGRPRKDAKERHAILPPPAAVMPGGKPYAVLMVEAKAAYLALLEREKDAAKGGRPKGSGRGGQRSIAIPRSRRSA